MFFILSKLIGFVTVPYTWAFALFVWAFITRKKLLKKRLVITAFAVLYLFSNAFIFDEVCRMWESKFTLDNQVPNNSIAILLGGYASYDETIMRTELQSSGDRLYQTLRLNGLKNFEYILLNGGSGSLTTPHLREANYVYADLVKMGFSESKLLVEANSKNTHQNAVEALKLLKEKGLEHKPLVLITSAYHMPRALACFKKVGLNPMPFAVNRKSGPRKFYFDHLFIPQAWIINDWNFLMREMVGYTVYKVMGYI